MYGYFWLTFVEATKNDPTESVLPFRHHNWKQYQFETVFS